MDERVSLQMIRERGADRGARPGDAAHRRDAGGGAAPLWLKCENLQRSGAFKIRGAANMLLQLPAPDSGPGVITYSSGNHGLALALAARNLGCPAVIVMPENAPRGESRRRARPRRGGHLRRHDHRSSARPGPRPKPPRAA